jgi:hypothetical protein
MRNQEVGGRECRRVYDLAGGLPYWPGIYKQSFA